MRIHLNRAAAEALDRVLDEGVIADFPVLAPIEEKLHAMLSGGVPEQIPGQTEIEEMLDAEK